MERLRKDLEVVNSQIERLSALLSSDFAAKAPAPVVEKEKLKLNEYLETREKLLAQIGKQEMLVENDQHFLFWHSS